MTTPSHHRRSIRLPGYDYTQPGAYFITLNTQGRAHLFGKVIDGKMVLSPAGQIVQEEWDRTAEVRPEVQLDAFMIMPDHVHGILIITDPPGEPPPVGASRRLAPTGAPSGSLGAILGQIKSITAKRINALRGTPGAPVWQRNYYERIIRTQEEWDRTRLYIENNPAKWQSG